MRDNVKYLHDKAKKAIFSLFQKTKSLGPLPPTASLTLFDVYIKPILLYGSDVWGCSKIVEKNDCVLLGYMKSVLGIKQNTCNVMVYGETGKYPISLEAMLNSVKYFVRLYEMREGSLVKQMFNELTRSHNSGFSTWISEIRSMLNRYSVDYSEINKDTVTVFKEAIHTVYLECWRNKLNSNIYPIVRTYKLLKNDYCMEPYLYNNKDYKFRHALCKLRTSSHLLEIEKGRHSKPKTDLSLRICKLCNNKEIEDEFHFLIECHTYIDGRFLLYERISEIDNNFLLMEPTDKFKFLMANDNIFINVLVSKFIYHSFKLREQKIGDIL